MEFETRFTVTNAEYLSGDRKRFYLTPTPTWPGGPGEMTTVVSDVESVWSIGEEVKLLVNLHDFTDKGHLPPPQAIRLRYELSDALRDQNYEWAAIVRDEIKRIEGEI